MQYIQICISFKEKEGGKNKKRELRYITKTFFFLKGNETTHTQYKLVSFSGITI